MILHLFHFFLDMIPFIYILFFSKNYDYIIVTIVFIQCLHWLVLKNECSLSYLEKQLINPSYELGQDISYIPHEDIFYDNIYVVIVMHFLQICVFIYILHRSKQSSYIVSLASISILIMIYTFKIRYFKYLI
jgi:hypothetical protein